MEELPLNQIGVLQWDRHGVNMILLVTSCKTNKWWTMRKKTILRVSSFLI